MIPTFSPATTITSIYASTLVVNHTPPILVTRTSTLTHNPAATATMTQVSSLATTVTSTYISTLVVNHGSPVLVTFTSTSTYHPAANPALTKVLTITGLPYTNTVTVTILEVALSRVMTGFCYRKHLFESDEFDVATANPIPSGPWSSSRDPLHSYNQCVPCLGFYVVQQHCQTYHSSSDRQQPGYSRPLQFHQALE